MKSCVQLAGAVAGVFLAVAAGAAPAAAAAVQQVRSFNHSQTLAVNAQSGTANGVKPQDLEFAPFDMSLGTLTGVSWSLSSDYDYDLFLSLQGDLATLTVIVPTLTPNVTLAGAATQFGPPILLPTTTCKTSAAPQCPTGVHRGYDFDFEVAANDLSLFLGSDPITARLLSMLGLFVSTEAPAVVGSIGLVSVQSMFAWSGDLRLTYIYEPTAGVPEPGAWALMILGFGLGGAALRRRGAFAT